MKKFYPKQELVYCVKVTDIQIERNEKLAKLLNKTHTTWYLGPDDKKTDKVEFARFWKDKRSAESSTRWILEKYKDTKTEILEFTLLEFINMMDQLNDTENYVSKRNKKLKDESVKYLEDKRNHLKKYKCTSAYKFPDKWQTWDECPNCNLRPLIWTFNNGQSTACGCGNNEYDHFSIHAESIMSYVTRNNGSALGFVGESKLRENWNHWVRTGQELEPHKTLIKNGMW